MEIIKGIYTVELGLYLRAQKTLVISDVHLGYEGSLEKRGVLVPRFQLKDVLASLKRIFESVCVNKIIISGDLKHEFGGILKQEWMDLEKFFEFLKDKKVIIVRGNHDVILGHFAKKAIVVTEYRFGNTLIIHGDKLPKTLHAEVQTIIMGHEHPAITLHECGRTEKFKCFLKGTYNQKNLIVLPSFNPLTEGSDILQEEYLSPLLKDLKKFEVFVYDAKRRDVLDFGLSGFIRKCINHIDRVYTIN